LAVNKKRVLRVINFEDLNSELAYMEKWEEFNNENN